MAILRNQNYRARLLLKNVQQAIEIGNLEEARRFAKLLIEKQRSSFFGIGIRVNEKYKDEAKSIISDVDLELAREEEKRRKEKAELEARVNKWIKKEYDEFEQVTFYSTKRNTTYHPERYGPSFKVEIYIGHTLVGGLDKAKEQKNLRLKTEYKHVEGQEISLDWLADTRANQPQGCFSFSAAAVYQLTHQQLAPVVNSSNR